MSKKEEEKKKGKKKKREAERREEKVVCLPLKPEYEVIDEYWVVEPFAKVKIADLPEMGGQKVYFVEEAELTEEERKAVDKLIDILSVELEPPESFEENVREHVLNEARRLANKYRKSVRGLKEESWEKVIYYIERDLLGYGPIEVMMRDYKLEDISCDGVDRAVHVWHRDYESIPTNLIFRDRDYLREFIVKLAHMAGKHISAAFPIVDAMLPGRHRLAATFGEEVSPKGSTFSIRKYREKPLSIINLLESGNIDEWTAAYLWLMMENRMTVLIIGATAAGKTTLLNALTSFFKPGFKIITIEETPELNLPHENWVQLVSRESYGLGETKIGEISLYDLVKVSLRYRPDYIIVGEIRGSEAFVLFQAMSTGHGGMSTMHADSLARAVKRLVSPPMNVSSAYIPSLNIAILTERTMLPKGGFGRRVRYVWEVEDYERYREIVRWNPNTDKHAITGDSHLLSKLAERLGRSVEDLYREIVRRQVVLTWMKLNGISEMKEVAKAIYEYYSNPSLVYERAVADLRKLGFEPERLLRRPLAVAPSTSGTYRRAPSRRISPPRRVAIPEPAPPREERPEVQAQDEKDKLLKILHSMGGEADHRSLLALSGLSREEFVALMRSLASSRLVVPSIIYVDNRPMLGYKLTADGEKMARGS